MNTESPHPWQHSHTFGLDKYKPAEKYTLIVIWITAFTMIVEIVAGLIFGSMALLADGLHMGSHTLALGISAFAYSYARKHANDERFSFGTGKVYSLSGFSSAIILAFFAFFMVWESVQRFLSPVEIQFNQAILVAVIGLLVNLVSMLILQKPSEHSHDSHHHHHEEGHSHDHSHHHHHHTDHNLKAAYLHVLADALTSLFAIFALLAGKYYGLIWMDPFMGVVGAIMVTRWAWGLVRDTSAILLDKQAPEELRNEIKSHLEQGTDRVADLHVWPIGADLFSAIISIVTENPQSPEVFKAKLQKNKKLVHVTVEVWSKE